MAKQGFINVRRVSFGSFNRQSGEKGAAALTFWHHEPTVQA
jgi:hypothetical protein